MSSGEGRLRELAVAAAAGAVLSACGGSGITATRLERAIAPAFANLVHVQVSRIGLPPVAASELAVVASCYRSGGGNIGAGEWLCTLVWSGPNRTTLRDTYDVAVTPDGCYAATVDAAETRLGGPAVQTTDGRRIRNLLYSFEGCFDTWPGS